MEWIRPLDKQRGSRPRCVLLVDDSRKEVAQRLTQLVDLPDVLVSPGDSWMPYGKPVQKDGEWDIEPSREAILSKPSGLVPPPIQQTAPGLVARGSPKGQRAELGHSEHLHDQGPARPATGRS